ncbi:AzlC family ABC transporter permease [Planctomonas deserti]|uniref:AzlC family ABC transporter permease n=1 Tax=Planctomonas deserti TaxID=2144185 RepID=UPI000D3AEA6B|nr:AzlC family ABC transporter permease [Planctomonas deserti]
MARSEAERAAVRAGIAVGVATGAYGISFGALSVAAGLDFWQTVVLSSVMFTGGSQFALVGVLASGGLAAGPAAIASAVLLGSRNALYSIRMSPIIGSGLLRRIAAAWITIDESTAVATAQTEPRAQRLGFWVTGLAVFVGWNAMTAVGALIGDQLGDVRQYGLDAAAAAAFLGLLWPRLREVQPIAVAVGAAVVATVLTPVVPSGLPVLAAALVAVLVGAFNWFSRPAETLRAAASADARAGNRDTAAGTAAEAPDSSGSAESDTDRSIATGAGHAGEEDR